MGFGDEIMATGMARGARARGKRIAFGDGRRIIWGPWSEPMFRGNPNIAPPGDEAAPDIEWIAHYKGHRLYNRVRGGRWLWNMAFRPQAGELFFSDEELAFAASVLAAVGPGFIVIEPNVPWHKSVAANKDWGAPRYQEVARRLGADGRPIMQFVYPGARVELAGVTRIETSSFRHALAVLSHASLYIGPEGGLHHGAAAVGVPGVVLFGGFIPPAVTGYPNHRNITGGRKACGSLKRCEHCAAAMRSISVDEVLAAAGLRA